MRKVSILKKLETYLRKSKQEEKEILQKIEVIYNTILKKYIKKNGLRINQFHLIGDKIVSIVRYEDEDVDINFYTPFIARRHAWLSFRFDTSGKLVSVVYPAGSLVPVKLEDLLEGYQCMKGLSTELV